MQPCPTCGGMGIDTNGFCTNCRTYRGIPQFGGNPVSVAPYGGMPAGGAPQVSAQPYPQPVSPGAYPGTTYGGAFGPPTAPPRKKRNSFVMPVLALSGVLVIIVVAIVIVVVVKNNGSKGGTTTADAKVDKCVVGSWTMTSYSENVPIDQVGNVPFTLSGPGSKFTFDSKGKVVEDYGSGTVFTGNVTQAGTTVPVKLTISGTVSGDIGTNNGAMSYANLKSTAKAVVSAAGQNQTQPFTASTDPSNYTCSGDKMTLSTSTYKEELKRSS
jgi:hypothetical protein